MTELANFSDLANVKTSEVKPPAVLPTGHYQAIITGLFKPHKAKSGNQAMRFPFKLIAPGGDVDAEALEEAGGIPDKEYTIDFWMSPDARFRFTDFGKAMGLDDGDPNLLELAERLGTCNTPFLIEVRHEPAKDTAGNDDLTKPPFMRFDNPAAL